MVSLIYDSALYDSITGGIDFAVDGFKAMLVGPGYVADKAGHSRRSDVSDEIAGRGYEAGGAEVEVAARQADGLTEISLGGALWGPASFGAAGAVYYTARGGSAEGDELVAYIAFADRTVATNGNFTLARSVIELAAE